MRLGKMIKIYCEINDISMRQVAQQIGISHATVCRIMEGKETNITTAIALLGWLIQEETPKRA